MRRLGGRTGVGALDGVYRSRRIGSAWRMEVGVEGICSYCARQRMIGLDYKRRVGK